MSNLPVSSIRSFIVTSKIVPHPLIGPWTIVATRYGGSFTNSDVSTVISLFSAICTEYSSVNGTSSTEPPVLPVVVSSEPAVVGAPVSSEPAVVGAAVPLGRRSCGRRAWRRRRWTRSCPCRRRRRRHRKRRRRAPTQRRPRWGPCAVATGCGGGRVMVRFTVSRFWSVDGGESAVWTRRRGEVRVVQWPHPALPRRSRPCMASARTRTQPLATSCSSAGQPRSTIRLKSEASSSDPIAPPTNEPSPPEN